MLFRSNGQLIERGGRLIETTHTAPLYKLYALADTQPPKPGLVQVGPTHGHSIQVEVWSMPVTEYGSFVAAIPAPLGIGTLTLHDGCRVQGFLCEAHALEKAQDISHFGGWRAYVQSKQTHSPQSV